MYDECRGCKLYKYDTPECSCSVGIPRHKVVLYIQRKKEIIKPICTDMCKSLIDYMRLFYWNETDLAFSYRVYLIKQIRGGINERYSL